MATNSTKKMWPNNSAIVVSDETNLALIMKTLIVPLNWRLDLAPCNATTALDHFHNGLASAVIVIDSPTLPAHESLRIFYKDPRGRLVPTMVLLSENCGNDMVLYEKVFKTAVAKKPLSASNFIPTFKALVKDWEAPVMQALRTISYSSLEENIELKINVLERLLVDANAIQIALPALIQIYITKGQYKDAEKKLLEIFKLHPKNPLILAQCGWFYLAAKMPHQALLFLNKLKAMAPETIALNFDIVAAHLACGQLTEASILLAEWLKKFPNNELISSFLARILYSDGQIDNAEKFGVPRNILGKVADKWDSLETETNVVKAAPQLGNFAS